MIQPGIVSFAGNDKRLTNNESYSKVAEIFFLSIYMLFAMVFSSFAFEMHTSIFRWINAVPKKLTLYPQNF